MPVYSLLSINYLNYLNLIKWQNIFLAVLYYGTVVIVGVAVGLQTHNGFHAITFVLHHQQ